MLAASSIIFGYLIAPRETVQYITLDAKDPWPTCTEERPSFCQDHDGIRFGDPKYFSTCKL